MKKDPSYHPQRKYKGRCVFQGNNVQDELRDWAIFNDLGANTAPLEGAKLIDLYGLQPGYTIQTADADQAYIQAMLQDKTIEKDRVNGTKQETYCETWITIPDDYLPKKWAKLGITDPVVRLRRALYGHPDAGGFWEQHLVHHLNAVGFTKAHENWPSVYWHDDFQCLLFVYVDDFKMAGPADRIAE